MSTTAPNAAASSIALLRTLSHAKVKFIRYVTLDVAGNVRCKVIPVDYLRKHPAKLLDGVALAQVSVGGFPSYADHVLLGSGLNAVGSFHLRPDLATLRVLPYSPDSAIVLGNLSDEEAFCFRSLLQRVAERAFVEHNITFTVGAELEFVLFDATTGRPVEQSNFADVVLLNQQHVFVSAVYDALQQQEIIVELIHSESAAGQMEIVLAYVEDPVMMADHVLLARETIKALARQHGMKAIFLPKTNVAQAGNGCHVHLSLRDAVTGKSKFAANPTMTAHRVVEFSAIMSPTGQSFVEGILQQLPALMAVTMPTTNSFRRVGPGCWTGSQAVWAVDDKEAPLRVIVAPNDASRVEFKLCDSTANLYLALAALLTAGLDGIKGNLLLRAPLSEEAASPHNDTVPHELPTSIRASLECLETNKLMCAACLPRNVLNAYLTVRRAEADRAANMSLDEEVVEALDRA